MIKESQQSTNDDDNRNILLDSWREEKTKSVTIEKDDNNKK